MGTKTAASIRLNSESPSNCLRTGDSLKVNPLTAPILVVVMRTSRYRRTGTTDRTRIAELEWKKMKTREALRTGLLAATISCFLAGCGHLKEFHQMDTDGNGRVDRNEAKQTPEVADFFNSADDDNSDDLDKDEYGSIVYILRRERKEVPRRSGGKGNVDVGH